MSLEKHANEAIDVHPCKKKSLHVLHRRICPFAPGITLLAIGMLAGCATGEISLSKPKVYEHARTIASMSTQNKASEAAMRGIDASGLNQFSSTRQSIENQISVAGRPYDPASTSALSVPTASAATLPSSPISTNPAAVDYKGLFSEVIQDQLHKQNAIEGMRLGTDPEPYAKDGSRIYRIDFDAWIQPEITDARAYFERATPDILTGLWDILSLPAPPDYREDYNVKITFDVGDSGIEVLGVMPESENITALEAMANAQQFGLAAAAEGVYQGIQGRGEYQYRNRLEEQFAELRKYPTLRGHVIGNRQFEFIISPRRRISERNIFNPKRYLSGKYYVASKLETGTRKLTAYVRIEDPSKHSPNSESITANISVTARYTMEGNPLDCAPLQFTGEPKSKGRSTLQVQLPLDPKKPVYVVSNETISSVKAVSPDMVTTTTMSTIGNLFEVRSRLGGVVPTLYRVDVNGFKKEGTQPSLLHINYGATTKNDDITTTVFSLAEPPKAAEGVKDKTAPKATFYLHFQTKTTNLLSGPLTFVGDPKSVSTPEAKIAPARAKVGAEIVITVPNKIKAKSSDKELTAFACEKLYFGDILSPLIRKESAGSPEAESTKYRAIVPNPGKGVRVQIHAEGLVAGANRREVIGEFEYEGLSDSP